MPYAKDDGQSISSFVLGVQRWTRKAKTRLDTVTQEINMEILARIVMRSPVDTGLFRGNWQVGIGRKPRGVLTHLDRDGAETIARLSGTIQTVRAGQKLFFTNNLPYALALEYGHSKQAPAGMVRVTIAEFHAITTQSGVKAKMEVP